MENPFIFADLLQKNVLRKLAFLLSFLVLSLIGWAQNTGTIRGIVYEKSTNETYIGAAVQIQGTAIYSVTDNYGNFSINKLAPGKYTLVLKVMGFEDIVQEIELKAGELKTVKLYLVVKSKELGEIRVSAEKQDAKILTQVSVTKITPKEISKVPSVGGEPEFAQYLQILPGVTFTGDQGGQLYIRGGSPVQNKVLLDGMIIYNPFHSIGLFSVFDADIIRNADVYTGGFAANYGGRISSIMDITTRNGNSKHLSGKISVNTFGSKLLFEGPFKKQKEGSGFSSFLLSAKTSYLDQTSKFLYQYNFNDTKAKPFNLGKDTTGLGIPYSFNDFYAKISTQSNNGSRFNVYGFSFNDKVNYSAVTNFKWNSYGAGTDFLVIPAAAPVLISGNISYSNYKINLTETTLQNRSSQISGFNVGLNFTQIKRASEIKYGLEVVGFNTDFNYFTPANRFIQQKESTTEIAAFVKYRINIRKLVLDPSFRFHYYASLGNASLEPRLSAKYNITDWLRVKYAGGFYSQNLISANSDRDVVNLFYGFLSGSDNLPSEYRGREIKSRLQKAIHNIFGFEVDLGERVSLNIEGYYKLFTQLTSLNRDKQFDDTEVYADEPDVLKKDFIIETGKAYGLDVLFKYEYKRLYVWLGYSLSRVTRSDEFRTDYNPFFDRRHNVNFVTSYNFGKDLAWEIDFRWNLGSGFPTTPTQGYFENLNSGNGINTNFNTSNGSMGILYGELNTKRLPWYHRLDFNIKRRFVFKNDSQLGITLGCTNLYNRENIFYFDRIRYKRVNQLPILPTLGITYSF
ncbi:MAG: TonB-dependent receptor [Bacteroidia bacterium]|nr:TonB-dependent receptor [Bacteroidia bacterium]